MLQLKTMANAWPLLIVNTIMWEVIDYNISYERQY